jgi:indole-3-glycerol phosphate synthase
MILDRIVAAKREAHARREPMTLDALMAQAAKLPAARPFATALRGDRIRVIAEFKRRSPSAGEIRPGADPAAIAGEYARAGAAALSVLTDREFFDGDPQHVAIAKGACGLPILRKDFLLDERDLVEARLLGADAALLIVRILKADQLKALIALAGAIGLSTLVEAHDDREVAAALAAGARVIGVNHRDLDTLRIDLALSARARQVAGPDAVLVAESGIKTRDDVRRMRDHGADAILVGESLMKSPSPGAALAELLDERS